MAGIVVTGGAGYIGSHTCRHLLAAGHRVVVLDDLSSGHRQAVDDAATLTVCSLADPGALAAAVDRARPDVVVHFAGAIEPSLSAGDPARFYAANVVGGLNLLNALLDGCGPVPVVFSSTSAVYGEPLRLPLREGDPTRPSSVYGETKLAFERLLGAYGRAYGVRSVSLRYFNACGAAPGGDIGPDHRHPVHLVTRALRVALGALDHLDVHGTDYPTPDGTCIRDYVHVEDLAAAHVVAVEWLLSGGGSDVFNVGLGRGFSVTEVVDAAERVTGMPIPRRPGPRRDGDPSAVVADPARIAGVLGWAPACTDLDAMIASAWRWHRAHPCGYAR